MRQRAADSKVAHHTLQANDPGAAVVAVGFFDNGLAMGSEAITVNLGFPRAAKLIGVFAHAACAAINVAGDWTLRIKDGATGTDLATGTMPLATAPGGSKTIVAMSSQVVIQPGVTYYMEADGPSRNFVIARLTLEWEIL